MEVKKIPLVTDGDVDFKVKILQKQLISSNGTMQLNVIRFHFNASETLNSEKYKKKPQSSLVKISTETKINIYVYNTSKLQTVNI